MFFFWEFYLGIQVCLMSKLSFLEDLNLEQKQTWKSKIQRIKHFCPTIPVTIAFIIFKIYQIIF